MMLVSKINEIQKTVKQWRAQGLSVGLVPTMGALHEGHKSLILKAKNHCDKVVVSIFVNPTQFGPNEDFDKYPRTIEEDKKACNECNADVIFAPSPSEMYSDCKNNITLVVPPASYTNKLCGKTRPEHFDGVCTVVLKLFNIVQPDKAFFGQKDAQQLIIIKKMCNDLNVPIEIIGCPIIRGEDGLALSSRNSYLSAEDRKKACSLNKVLKKIAYEYSKGANNKAVVFEEALKLLNSDMELEYIEACNDSTLEDAHILDDNTLVAIAAKISNVRLIDNIMVKESQ